MSSAQLVKLDTGKAAAVLGLAEGAVVLAIREAWNRATVVHLYSVEEVAEVLSVSVRTVWNLVNERHLAPTHFVGRQRRIPEDAIHRYLEARKV